MATLEMENCIRCKNRPPDPEEHRRERVRRAREVVADLGGAFAEPRIGKTLQVVRDYVKGGLGAEELIAALVDLPLTAREATARATAAVWTLAEAHRAAAAGATRQAALAVLHALRQALDPAGCLRQPAAQLDRCWLTSTVVALIQLIEGPGQYELPPILADALADAGCEDAAILDHFRTSSPHGSECCIVAAILRAAGIVRVDSHPVNAK